MDTHLVIIHSILNVNCKSTDTETFYGKTVQAYGWGDTKFLSRNGSDVLLETNLTVVTREVCQKMWLPHCKRMAMYEDEEKDAEKDEDDEEDDVEDEYRECLNNYLTDGMLCAGSLGKSPCHVSTNSICPFQFIYTKP